MPIDVAREERPTIDPAIPTAFALNSRATRPQKMKPRTALPMLPASTQPPCSRTRAASETPSVERTGLIQGNSQPSMTPMKEGNEGGPIRIPELAVERLFPSWKAARGHDPSIRGLRPGPNLQLEPNDRRAPADRRERDPWEEPGRPNERGCVRRPTDRERIGEGLSRVHERRAQPDAALVDVEADESFTLPRRRIVHPIREIGSVRDIGIERVDRAAEGARDDVV